MTTSSDSRPITQAHRPTESPEDNKIQQVPKIRLVKEPPARKGFVEVPKLEELVRALPSHLRPLILFLYWCGVRLGEALSIEWSQVELDARLIRPEDDQTKTGEARVVPLPSVLVMLLAETEPKVGKLFTDTNLRTEWARACAAVGLGKRELVKPKDGYAWHRYNGLIVHDLRRSAIRNLVNAGVPERVAMRISGHKTRAVFDRLPHCFDRGCERRHATSGSRRITAKQTGPAQQCKVSAKPVPQSP